MNRKVHITLATFACADIANSLISNQLRAQVAGSSLVSLSVTELRDVTKGWSARKQIIGWTVFNEEDETIGTIDDVIVSPSKNVSYAIVGAGGFLGLARHDVVVPVRLFSQRDGKFLLNGATKEAIMTLPQFEYGPQ
jgi:hypothetical protein